MRRWERSRERELSVAFGNPRNGWIDCSMRAGEQSFAFAFSYIYPALLDLCRGLTAIAAGAREAAVVFLLEPDELLLALRHSQPDGCLETALELKRRGGAQQLGSARVFQFHGTIAKTVLVFWRALRRLQTGLSQERFLQEWGMDFPEGEMLALTSAVRKLKA